MQTLFEIMRSEQCLKCEAKTLKLLKNTILSPAADQQAPATSSTFQGETKTQNGNNNKKKKKKKKKK